MYIVHNSEWKTFVFFLFLCTCLDLLPRTRTDRHENHFRKTLARYNKKGSTRRRGQVYTGRGREVYTHPSETHKRPHPAGVALLRGTLRIRARLCACVWEKQPEKRTSATPPLRNVIIILTRTNPGRTRSADRDGEPMERYVGPRIFMDFSSIR